MHNDKLSIDDVLRFLNEVDLMDELDNIKSEKIKTCKKTIVKEYKRKCPRNMIKALNLLNDIEMSYEHEKDDNNNYCSENTKVITDINYQCC